MIVTASLVAAIIALAVFLMVTHRISLSKAETTVAVTAPVPVKEGFFARLFGDITEKL
jgi:hypothetical protein